MKLQSNKLFVLSVLALSTFASCAKHSETQGAIAGIQQTTSSVAGVASETSALGRDTTKVESVIKLRKSAVLNRPFLYGAGLQFSSIVDGKLKTAMMSQELGQLPVYFNINGGTLQLMTDGSLNFESDVNHPSRLVHEFDIVSQDNDTISIRVVKPSPVIDTFMWGNDNKVPLRVEWNRSVEYVESNELLMVESSVELTDGSVGEFMETLVPRDRQVPANFKAISANADDNDAAARYRFLDAGKVFLPKDSDPTVRAETKIAMRWALKNGEAVKWYITSNVPDEYLNDVKNGVEGWNRYTRAAGLPDIIKFMGKLPAGVKVGDPRFNLIVWDTVQQAGAAYESQNADPVTGVQQASMIYIPLAWVNIGKEYWKKTQASEAPPSSVPSQGKAIEHILAQRSFMGRPIPVHCMNDVEMHLDMASKKSPEDFARGLLKGVIFHEVGHSFGLAHNFKGSLSFDPDDAKKSFSTSIMDYNDYNEEAAAFSSVDSSDGPLLEYDRQIISVLYNGGKDVKASDPKLPACADDEADSTDAGVDPLCIRYDIGYDPTKQALRSLELLTNPQARSGRMNSLPAALADALADLPAATGVKTTDDADAALKQALTDLAGVTSIYVGGSANSLGYIGSTALKSLKVFQKGVLLDGYNETDMRENALSMLEQASSMTELPDATKQALAKQKTAILAYLAGTPALTSMSRADQDKTLADYGTKIDTALAANQTAALSKMRGRLIDALKNTPTAPLAFHKRNGQVLDLEVVVMGVLEQLAAPKAGSADRPMAERTQALTSLKTYSGADSYQAVSDRVQAELTKEIQSSTDALQRQALRNLLTDFTSADSADSSK
jgi:Met-zincin